MCMLAFIYPLFCSIVCAHSPTLLRSNMHRLSQNTRNVESLIDSEATPIILHDAPTGPTARTCATYLRLIHSAIINTGGVQDDAGNGVGSVFASTGTACW